MGGKRYLGQVEHLGIYDHPLQKSLCQSSIRRRDDIVRYAPSLLGRYAVVTNRWRSTVIVGERMSGNVESEVVAREVSDVDDEDEARSRTYLGDVFDSELLASHYFSLGSIVVGRKGESRSRWSY